MAQANLSWSPRAIRDVASVHQFFADKNPDAGRRAIKAIQSGVKVLEAQPALGRAVEGMDLEFREWLIDFGHGGYVVRYRYDGRNVVILAIRHQKEAGFNK